MKPPHGELTSSDGLPVVMAGLGAVGRRGVARAVFSTVMWALAASSAGGAPPAGPGGRVVDMSIAGDQVSGAGLLRSGASAPTLRLRQGDAVVLRWTSDRPLVLHLHGYRLAVEAGPGRVADMAFTARAAGRFAVETHRPDGRHAALLYLEVMPR